MFTHNCALTQNQGDVHERRTTDCMQACEEPYKVRNRGKAPLVPQETGSVPCS